MKLSTNESLEIVRFSDSNYDMLTAEIRYLGEPIAQLNQDKGKENLELELFTEFGDPSFKLKFPLDDFSEALKLAEATLKE